MITLICTRQSASGVERRTVRASGWNIWDLLTAGQAWQANGYDVRVKWEK